MSVDPILPPVNYGMMPPCANCGHEYQDHEEIVEYDLDLTKYPPMPYIDAAFTVCHGGNNCNCDKYKELDKEEYWLRAKERHLNL